MHVYAEVNPTMFNGVTEHRTVCVLFSVKHVFQ